MNVEHNMTNKKMGKHNITNKETSKSAFKGTAIDNKDLSKTQQNLAMLPLEIGIVLGKRKKEERKWRRRRQRI